jgi:hypothetical protein
MNQTKDKKTNPILLHRLEIIQNNLNPKNIQSNENKIKTYKFNEFLKDISLALTNNNIYQLSDSELVIKNNKGEIPICTITRQPFLSDRDRLRWLSLNKKNNKKQIYLFRENLSNKYGIDMKKIYLSPKIETLEDNDEWSERIVNNTLLNNAYKGFTFRMNKNKQKIYISLTGILIIKKLLDNHYTNSTNTTLYESNKETLSNLIKYY